MDIFLNYPWKHVEILIKMSHWDTFNEYSQYMLVWKNKKKQQQKNNDLDVPLIWSYEFVPLILSYELTRYLSNHHKLNSVKVTMRKPAFNTPLRKHAYSNILNFYHQKNENFQIKNSDIFLISAQNIDCGYSLEPPHRGGSNEYPQSMFWAEIRKIMFTPLNPSFTI